MLLCPQGSGDVLTALHDLPTLIIDAEDAGHTVSAGAAFQRGRYVLLISDGSGARASSSRKTGYKGLLLYPRLSLQRACYIMQVTHLVPLVGGEGHDAVIAVKALRGSIWLCHEGLHLHIGRCHQRA